MASAPRQQNSGCFAARDLVAVSVTQKRGAHRPLTPHLSVFIFSLWIIPTARPPTAKRQPIQKHFFSLGSLFSLKASKKLSASRLPQIENQKKLSAC
jgi:hypothetical protein